MLLPSNPYFLCLGADFLMSYGALNFNDELPDFGQLQRSSLDFQGETMNAVPIEVIGLSLDPPTHLGVGVRRWPSGCDFVPLS